MDTYLQTKRMFKTVPDPRPTRRDVILQALRDPERLDDEQIQALLEELAELQKDMQQHPVEEQ